LRRSAIAFLLENAPLLSAILSYGPVQFLATIILIPAGQWHLKRGDKMPGKMKTEERVSLQTWCDVEAPIYLSLIYVFRLLLNKSK